MAEMLGHEGHQATTASAGQTPGDAAAAFPVEARSRARFEHEAAALDLSDAEQLSAWSAAMAEQGDAAESQRLANISVILYESAKRRRQTAERLERELRQCDSATDRAARNDVEIDAPVDGLRWPEGV